MEGLHGGVVLGLDADLEVKLHTEGVFARRER